MFKKYKKTNKQKKSLLQHHSSKASILRHSAFFPASHLSSPLAFSFLKDIFSTIKDFLLKKTIRDQILNICLLVGGIENTGV